MNSEKKKNHTGLIVGIIIGIILFLMLSGTGIYFLIHTMFPGNKFNSNSVVKEEKTFIGESFEIKYKYPWIETTTKLTSGEEEKILNYNNGQIRLLPIGSSDLSKTATTDFKTSSGKFKLYNEFRE